MAKRIFSGGKKLKDTIEERGWSLFETNATGRPLTWQEVEAMGPAKEYAIGRNYIFLELPMNGERLRDRYKQTFGFGPSLSVDNNSNANFTMIYRGSGDDSDRPLFFSRLFFFDDNAACMSIASCYNKDPDMIGIQYKHLLRTFRKRFSIASPNDYKPVLCQTPFIDLENDVQKLACSYGTKFK